MHDKIQELAHLYFIHYQPNIEDLPKSVSKIAERLVGLNRIMSHINCDIIIDVTNKLSEMLGCLVSGPFATQEDVFEA